MRTAKTDETKFLIFEKVAAIASTFGSPARLKILCILAQAPRSVEAVAGITGESVANTSQHLRRLLNEGIVVAKKEKLSRIYRLNDDSIALLIESLYDLAERISPEMAHAERDLIEADIGNTVDLSEIVDELRGKKALLLDVREDYEASASPIVGALSLPLDVIKRRATSLAKTKTYYLFCRGRSCEIATQGVRILRSMGFRAYRLKESPASIKKAVDLTSTRRERA